MTEPSSAAPHLDPLPYSTAALAGVGGRLKGRPEDFVVEEIPAYEPCGEGDHLFLWIEKRDVSAEALLRHVSRALGVPGRDLGMAGLKDRRAITRQYLSVPAQFEAAIGAIDTESIHVLRAGRHRNKLRTGHLRGNRFSILLRDVLPGAAVNAERLAEEIRRLGCPNYYGDQRFGHGGETLQLGWDLLRGAATADAIAPSRRRFLLRMALSSVQSAIFNRYLADRLRDGLLHTVLRGDVMQVAATGGPFIAMDPAVEQARFDRRETVVTGPMFGPKMIRPTDESAAREDGVLAAWNLNRESFTRYARLTSGTRRPVLLWPESLQMNVQPDGLRVEFQLPAGAYATTALRELMKMPADAPVADAEE